jgi:hypothetical protein
VIPLSGIQYSLTFNIYLIQVRGHEVRLELLVLLEKKAKLDHLALLGIQEALV